MNPPPLPSKTGEQVGGEVASPKPQENDARRCEQLQEENKQLKEALEAYLSAGHKETRRLASIKAKKAIGLPEDYKTPLSK